MSYILRRIGFYIVAAWASLTFNFFLPRLMPGDPGDAVMARMQGRVPPETINAMRTAYGLSDEPLIVQYFKYLGNLLRGDFGVSISAFQPEDLPTLLPNCVEMPLTMRHLSLPLFSIRFPIGNII